MELFTKILKIIFLSLVFTQAAILSVPGQDATAPQPREQSKTEYWAIDCQPGPQERQFPSDTAFVSVRFERCACALTEEDARTFAKAIINPPEYTDWIENHVNLETGYPEITMAFLADQTTSEVTLYCYDVAKLGMMVLNKETE